MIRGMLFEKVVVVTGAASGIGRAAAFAFARHGARLVLADVDRERGEEAAGALRAEGAEATFVAADVSRAGEVEALVGRAVERYGRLDGAFNNAGVMGVPGMGLTADCAEEVWDRVVATNLKGVFLCMKYEIAQMLKQGGGVIVNNASIAGLVGTPGFVAYSASKHGVLGLTKTAAAEYARLGVRINALCPGAVRTPLFESNSQGDARLEAAVAAMHPVGRIGRAEEVAEAAAWLVSDHASFVVGHALSVDGGLVAV